MSGADRAQVIREEIETCVLNARLYRAGNLTVEDFASRMANSTDVLETGTAGLEAVVHCIDAGRCAAWNGVPDATWLVTDLLPAEPSLVVLYGPSGSFKSFLAFDLCLALATGQRFLPPSADDRKVYGFEGFEMPRPGRTLYVAAEDAASRIKKRLAELRAFRGIDGINHGGAFDIHVVHWPNQRRPLLLSHSPHRLEVARMVNSEKYDLVVWDTLSESVRGIDENTKDGASQVVDWTNEIRAAGGSVVLVHHTRKPPNMPGPLPMDVTDPANMRGSSALHGAADVLIASSEWSGRNKDEDQIRVRVSKSRVMEKAGMKDMIVRVEGAPDEGLPAKFLYVMDYEPVNEQRQRQSKAKADEIVACVAELCDAGEPATVAMIAAKVGMSESGVRGKMRTLAGGGGPLAAKRVSRDDGKSFRNAYVPREDD